MLASSTDLGGYVIESVLRQDGAATLYRARNLQTRELVAMELATHPGAAERAQQFLCSGSRQLLDHPNLVPVTALLDTNQGTVVVSRLVEGVTLDEWLVEHPQPPLPVALDLFRDIVRGVAEAHGSGVFHGNLDPSCIIVFERDGLWRASVSGFSLPADAASSVGRTMAGYSAPERIREPTRVEAAADIFSLGCILSRLVAGRSPHEPRLAVVPDLQPELPNTLHRPPKSLQPELAHLVGALTRLDPMGRPPNCVWILVRLADPVLPPSSLSDGLARLSPAAESLALPRSLASDAGADRTSTPHSPEVAATPGGRADEDAGDSDTENEGMVLTPDQPTQPPVDQLSYLVSDAEVWVEVVEDEDSEDGALFDSMPTMDAVQSPVWCDPEAGRTGEPSSDPLVEVGEEAAPASPKAPADEEVGSRKLRAGALAALLLLLAPLPFMGLRERRADSATAPPLVAAEPHAAAAWQPSSYSPGPLQAVVETAPGAPAIEEHDDDEGTEPASVESDQAQAHRRPEPQTAVAKAGDASAPSVDGRLAGGEWVLSPVQVGSGSGADSEDDTDSKQRWPWNRTDESVKEVPVRVEGNAVRVELVRRGRTHRLPGTVRAGTYQVRAWFDDSTFVDAGEVEVVAGADNAISCQADQRVCR